MKNNIKMMHIPSGEFNMGSPYDEQGRYIDEDQLHHVTIYKPFYMGKYPVTQAQWCEVMGDNPSYFKGNNLPVENVSWDDVQEFIKKLNEKEDKKGYRLPSEAEWEYVARAGTTTRYSFGDDDSKLSGYAWYGENLNGKTHPVGKKKENPWELYDMYGNVWEWVQDEWHNSYNGAPTDGSAWEDGVSASRVDRGGSWFSDARFCRSAYRNNGDPGGRDRYLGFRLVRDVNTLNPNHCIQRIKITITQDEVKVQQAKYWKLKNKILEIEKEYWDLKLTMLRSEQDRIANANRG